MTAARLNVLVPCPMLDGHGERCGRPSVPWCSTPICEQHALEVYRAVSRLVGVRAGLASASSREDTTTGRRAG